MSALTEILSSQCSNDTGSLILIVLLFTLHILIQLAVTFTVIYQGLHEKP